MKNLFASRNNKDNATLSLGKTKVVCGYEIKKMPLGAYLRALARFETLPEEFLGRCFPGKSAQEVIDGVTKLDESMLAEAAKAAFLAAPSYIIGLVSELTEIDEERLLNDPDIGLIGITEIARAFIEVNGLGELKGKLSAILALAGSKTKTGFKG